MAYSFNASLSLFYLQAFIRIRDLRYLELISSIEVIPALQPSSPLFTGEFSSSQARNDITAISKKSLRTKTITVIVHLICSL